MDRTAPPAGTASPAAAASPAGTASPAAAAPPAGTAPAAVLAAFTEQLRRNAAPEEPGARVEREDRVVRVVNPDGWSGVVWSDLDAATADAAIGREVALAAGLPRWEWKHYGYDRPDDLPARLAAAGLVAGPAETLLVAQAADLAPPAPPPGIRLLQVTDLAGADLLVRVHEQVFGGDHTAFGRALRARLAGAPDTVAAVVAMAGERPVCAARVEFHRGTAFASLWGAGTLPDWRGRGIFRAVVAYRARLAARRGFRYLLVDALPASRPILERLGFVPLTTTTPYTPATAGHAG
jgi:GNAT superfamily N-acetyltransferase